MFSLNKQLFSLCIVSFLFSPARNSVFGVLNLPFILPVFSRTVLMFLFCFRNFFAYRFFLNFPVADMNRNVLWKNPEKVEPEQAARMTAFWGDESWREVAYDTTSNLFGYEEKTSNEEIAQAFQKRLKRVAGFKYVPDPVPMRNSKGTIVYYLFFASQKPAAESIVIDIFNKYRNRGVA